MAFALSDMQLTSPAFGPGGAIPKEHTGEGDNSSPALSWTNVPDGTQSFALICHDPDAPLVAGGAYGFLHWVLYNIPASVTSLAAGTSDHTSGPSGFGAAGYGGPMPPPGHGTHHYFFWLFALSSEPDLADGLSLGDLLEQIEPHTLGMNRLVGTYERN
ncbi:MAG: YbhB/YbcL family Raf kinase inhibitor-like protein [Dehalococcoidia bacterium]|nr:YbhB/YbcL family Raf kinase inhibitor-like protein [Dehalococcoidia bacterium]